ncbi:MAG: hypothetical protein ACK58U_20355, partial [Rubrivivax sp.]
MTRLTIPLAPLALARTAFLLLATLLLPALAWAQPLVDAAWLKARAGQPGWVLLDASPLPI